MIGWAIVTFIYCALLTGIALSKVRRVNRARALEGRPKFQLREAVQRCRFLLRPACILFVIHLFAISALLRANSSTVDDLVRIGNGVGAWQTFGRYTTAVLSRVVHMDYYLADVAPLAQILAALIMAAAGAVLIYLITGSTRPSLWSVIGALPLGLTPYFLACYAFRYDAVYMAVSVITSLLPLLFRRCGRAAYIAAAGFGVFLTCTTYQASLGVFPMVVALLLLLMWNRGTKARELLDFLLTSVAGYVVGVLSFRLFVMKAIATSYVSSKPLPLNRLLPAAVENYREYFQYLFHDFKLEWLLLCALILLAFLYAVARDSARRKPLALLASVCVLLAMALLCFGVYPILEAPLFMPRAMYGVGCFLACACIVVMSSRGVAAGKLVSLVLCWAFFVFAFTYGNAEYVQRKYTDFRATQVLQDLDELTANGAEGEEKYVCQLSGTIGLSPILRNMPQDYQMLNRLVSVTLQGGSLHGILEFQYYGSSRLEWGGAEIAEEAYAMPVLKDGTYHTIRGDGQRILVELKQ